MKIKKINAGCGVWGAGCGVRGVWGVFPLRDYYFLKAGFTSPLETITFRGLETPPPHSDCAAAPAVSRTVGSTEVLSSAGAGARAAGTAMRARAARARCQAT